MYFLGLNLGCPDLDPAAAAAVVMTSLAACARTALALAPRARPLSLTSPSLGLVLLRTRLVPRASYLASGSLPYLA